MRLRHRWLGPALALFAAPATMLARAEPLAGVVRDALKSHPALAAAAAGAESGSFLVEQARAARRPRFGLVADPGRRYDAAGGEVGDIGLRGSLLLYDGGRTRDSIAREEDRAAVAGANLRLTADEVAARACEIYLEWLRQERLAELAAGNVATHQSLYERVAEIASFDRGRGSDLLQVGARLEQARVTLAARRGAAREARAVLVQWVGRDVLGVEAPRGPGAFLPATPADAAPLLERHPAVLAADAEARAAQSLAQAAGTWNRPRVELLASAGSPTDLAGERRYFDDLSVRVAASWTPFDGGDGRAAWHAAERSATQAREQARAARLELSSRLASLWSERAAREERLRAQERVVQSAAAVRDAYWQQFTIGRRSIVDLLNAEQEAFLARYSAEDERLGLVQQEYRMLAALGLLTNWLGVEPAPRGAP